MGTGLVALVLSGSCAGVRTATGDETPGIFAPSFAGLDGLVANEHAPASPTGSAAASGDWEVTSGSLFARDGAGWSGVPDDGSPNEGSTDATGSAVFRAVGRGPVFSDVVVTARARVVRLVETGRTPARDWDGLHLFLRYQDPDDVYTVDVYRRDGSLTIKRKAGGDYETLARVNHPVPWGRWVDVRAEARTLVSKAVHITVRIDGERVLTATDAEDAAITRPGRVGVRGDNAEFYFRDFRAWTPRR